MVADCAHAQLKGSNPGTALEWYDYYIYGTAAALVFDKKFFSGLDPVAGTMASYATFAVGFVVRPLGAALFGHWGDKYGRRRMLLVTVVTIGVVTGVIGLLPTYQTIGVAAPILLVVMRILQGISVGGEWSGAATLAIEHAPIERRGRYAGPSTWCCTCSSGGSRIGSGPRHWSSAGR
ncbi:MAG: MFS transporter [Pseudonocardia sp.]|nr:MFS transporter [Pseudonocardia sp.]